MIRPSVVIVEPSSSGLDLIAAVTRAGYQALVFSHNAADRIVPAEVLARWGAELVVLDTNDPAAVLQGARDLPAQWQVLGILPGFEFYVPAAAQLAAHLGLPGLDPAVCQRVRDKALMRQALAGAGITGPKFRLVSTAAELDEAAAEVGYPLVIKPTRSAGSVHVSLASCLSELRSAYSAIAFDPTLDLGIRLGADVLVEEFIPGPEFSVEGFVQDGRVVVVSITEKLVSEPPHFVELGHTVPAAIEPACERLIAGWTADVARALGIDDTVFHLELRLRNGVPHVIELGARLPGDSIGSLIEMSKGVNLSDIFVQLATGQRVDDPAVGATGSASCVAAIRFFYEPGLDVVTSAPADSDLHTLPNVVNGAVTVSPGDRPNCRADFRSRLGWVLMTGADRRSVDRSWKAVKETARFT
ncbi:MAG TPA: ATP-grasp domain-containing protein [Jatrophihabitans sp.]|jgi:biotin carboxylase|uniref:ATP-grasp domain-containing protein n=1 Tax=Jatrophihabitans sp. TaxID=1932789 RepID=UPI002EF0DBFE